MHRLLLADQAQLPPASTDLPDQGQPVGTTASAPGASSSSPDSTQVDVGAAYNQGLKGIREGAEVEKQQAAANAQIQQDDINAKQDLLTGFNKNYSDFQTSQKQFMQDYMNNHIDPKHYQENMTSGQKVGTAIGLFLGGMSTPFTHQGNPALEFLNKQIDRDIDAQRMNMDKAKNMLLGANQEMFHDNVLATNATRIQLNDITSAKVLL